MARTWQCGADIGKEAKCVAHCHRLKESEAYVYSVWLHATSYIPDKDGHEQTHHYEHKDFLRLISQPVQVRVGVWDKVKSKVFKLPRWRHGSVYPVESRVSIDLRIPVAANDPDDNPPVKSSKEKDGFLSCPFAGTLPFHTSPLRESIYFFCGDVIVIIVYSFFFNQRSFAIFFEGATLTRTCVSIVIIATVVLLRHLTVFLQLVHLHHN